MGKLARGGTRPTAVPITGHSSSLTSSPEAPGILATFGHAQNPYCWRLKGVTHRWALGASAPSQLEKETPAIVSVSRVPGPFSPRPLRAQPLYLENKRTSHPNPVRFP